VGFEVFSALDRDWALVADSRQARTALAHWRPDPVLGVHRGLDELLVVLRASSVDAATKDEILAALARRARSDDVAARTLLQAIVPGLVNVAKRLHAFATDRQAELLGEAYVLVRTYPIERRPRAIAANLLWDTFSRLARDSRTQAVIASRETPLADQSPRAAEEPGFAAVELWDAIRRAVAGGHVRPGDVELVVSIACTGERVVERARSEGVPADTLQKRVERARRRVTAALVPTAVERVA
jgi:DNA-directed RNA polymerase specialized sigma24 family protein